MAAETMNADHRLPGDRARHRRRPRRDRHDRHVGGGLVHRASSGTQEVLRWADVQVFRLVRNRRDRVGNYLGTSTTYTLRHQDGRKFELAGILFRAGHLLALGEAAEQAIAEVRLPRALEALDQGRKPVFGDVSISKHGISDGADHLPWEQVESVHGVDDNTVRIMRVGAKRPWSTIPADKIPDLRTLLVLSDAMRRQSR